jgi:sigma-B regulation protein RsbU (phosphoserine phosphatase)
METAIAQPVRRILVVDDDADINRLIGLRLRREGYQVESACDGVEALARLAAAPPDMVFLDVSMPGIDGLQVLATIRARHLDSAVIMTTAFGSEQVAVEALRRGADDYLRKPFDPTEFGAVLERVAQKLELSRQNAALRRQVEEQRRRLDAELARAAEVQSDLLPQHPPALAGFELAARCIPAREVGGDFYDWQELSPGHLTLTLGDVMGKGLPAALLMATARATLRAATAQNPPAASLDLAGRALELDLERADSFLTVFHAQLDVETRQLTYVDAGHGHVLVRRAHGAVESLQPGGMPLGTVFSEGYEQSGLRLDPGDMLVVYTDGLVEARTDRLLDRSAIAAHLGDVGSAREAVDRLVDAVPGGSAPTDDLTLLALLCRGET